MFLYHSDLIVVFDSEIGKTNNTHNAVIDWLSLKIFRNDFYLDHFFSLIINFRIRPKMFDIIVCKTVIS